MSQAPSTLRRWLQFGLGRMLALVIVVAIPLAWVAKEQRQSRYELQIAKDFQSQGVDQITLGGPYDWDRNKPHAWWRDVARHVSGERILQLNASGATPHVTSLAPLAGLTNLHSVFLTHAPVRDLTPLARLTNLEFVYLYGGQSTTSRHCRDSKT